MVTKYRTGKNVSHNSHCEILRLHCEFHSVLCKWHLLKINCCAWTCQFYSKYLSFPLNFKGRESGKRCWSLKQSFFCCLQMPNKIVTADISHFLKNPQILFWWINYWWLYLTSAQKVAWSRCDTKAQLWKVAAHSEKENSKTQKSLLVHSQFLFCTSDFKRIAVYLTLGMSVLLQIYQL